MLLKLGSRGEEVVQLQKLLNNLTGSKLKPDGIFGGATVRAVVTYQEEFIELVPDGIVGDKTLTHMLSQVDKKKEPKPVQSGTETPWIKEAMTQIGINEHDNEEVVHQYWRDCKLSGLTKFPATKIPWCSGFTSAMLERAGIKSARTDGARNYLNWGIPLDSPAYGCIVIFSRGASLHSGHVGFVVGVDDLGHLMTLSGNVGDEVCIRSFRTDRVLGYRYPEGFTPSYNLVEYKPTELSTNEE